MRIDLENRMQEKKNLTVFFYRANTLPVLFVICIHTVSDRTSLEVISKRVTIIVWLKDWTRMSPGAAQRPSGPNEVCTLYKFKQLTRSIYEK